MSRYTLLSAALLAAPLAALLGAEPGAPPAVPKSVPPAWTVMFWNVENLYDTVDDPATEIVDAMDPADHAEKMRRLGQVVRRVGWGRGPDVLGLVEIESARLVAELAGPGYTVVFHEGKYERGLNVGLATRLPLAADTPPEFIDPGTTGRTILHAVLQAGPEALHVFVLHFKSKRNAAAAGEDPRDDEELRSKEARELRERIDDILDDDPRANVLVMGDFNEGYRDSLFRRELRSEEHWRGAKEPDVGDDDARLLNYGPALQQSFRQGGTCYYHPNWDIFDNFLLSEALAERKGLFAPPSEAYIGVSFDLLDDYGEPAKFDRGKPTGASDHLPILLRISGR
jgi:endonuclease/exonuclease/phosphatase family metal-dependent hydrolase